mmetsp:Transcript_45477/g.114031  ORF Transcript_45477/g.114031 Transcript_45477/m.114031 type:complete len:402 (-) Transcript_45477:109-1314(-)
MPEVQDRAQLGYPRLPPLPASRPPPHQALPLQGRPSAGRGADRRGRAPRRRGRLHPRAPPQPRRHHPRPRPPQDQLAGPQAPPQPDRGVRGSRPRPCRGQDGEPLPRRPAGLQHRRGRGRGLRERGGGEGRGVGPDAGPVGQRDGAAGHAADEGRAGRRGRVRKGGHGQQHCPRRGPQLPHPRPRRARHPRGLGAAGGPRRRRAVGARVVVQGVPGVAAHSLLGVDSLPLLLLCARDQEPAAPLRPVRHLRPHRGDVHAGAHHRAPQPAPPLHLPPGSPLGRKLRRHHHDNILRGPGEGQDRCRLVPCHGVGGPGVPPRPAPGAPLQRRVVALHGGRHVHGRRPLLHARLGPHHEHVPRRVARLCHGRERLPLLVHLRVRCAAGGAGGCVAGFPAGQCGWL